MCVGVVMATWEGFSLEWNAVSQCVYIQDMAVHKEASS